MKRTVIGILAHVDSGKTTLSEALLYRAGQIRRPGRVDHGDAFLDTDEIEREKGITIFSKQAVIKTDSFEFTLVDTPGHIDFSAETERTMSILDYAVLVISGTDGVQNHTRTLWRLLEKYNVPVFIFVNKTDIAQNSADALLEELKIRLDGSCIDFRNTDTEEFAENAALSGEELMEEYLKSGSVSENLIADAIKNRSIFPCMFGSALKFEGIDEFLKVLERYTLPSDSGAEFGAKVFKITEDENGGRLTHMKITSGTLKVKDILCGTDRSGEEWSEKADRIRIYSGERFTVKDTAQAGELAAVSGLCHTYPGEGLGCESDSRPPILEPPLTYSVEPTDGSDIHTLLQNLRRLEKEEPQLNVLWNDRLCEIRIRLMGEVQLEVLRRIIKDRFGTEVTFGSGSIAYRETIKNTVEGVGHFEPLRHYAEVHLILEPLERGSGLKFVSKCSEDLLDKNWQRLIMTHLREKTHIGVLTGSPITDMKITLAAGRAHKKHTEGGDFRQATYRAVRCGLRAAESVLLEPLYSFRLEVPVENVGRAMTDIQNMGGEFSQPQLKDDLSVITGSAPVSKMHGYANEVTAYTAGRGRLFCTADGYCECANADEIINACGYDADADTDNPCGSVFCSHGAGFNVRWDEVHSYMHIESVLKKKEEDETVTARASNYVNSVINDEELLRIFEKTYGPVKVRAHDAVSKRIKAVPDKRSIKKAPVKKDKEYILIDGYNIIFAWEDLAKAAEQSLDLAREILINRMCNYRGYCGNELILVFDAYKVKGNHGAVEQVHNISVVYTKEAQTADAYIEKTAHELAKNHRVRVATSDNLEQLIILGGGAERVSASAFEKEVCDAENIIRKFIEQTF